MTPLGGAFCFLSYKVCTGDQRHDSKPQFYIGLFLFLAVLSLDLHSQKFN